MFQRNKSEKTLWLHNNVKMGGKNQPKNGKSDIVANNTKPAVTRAGKKRKAQEGEAGGSNRDIALISEASGPDAQVKKGDVKDAAIDLSRNTESQAESENADEKMKMTTKDVAVRNEGAPTTGIAATREGVDRMSDMAMDTGVENTGLGFQETQRDGPKGERGGVAGLINEVRSEIRDGISTVVQFIAQVESEVKQAKVDVKELKSDLKDVCKRMTGLEESIKELKQEGGKTSDKLEAISEAVTAVETSVRDLPRDNTVVYMEQAGPSTGGMGAPRAHSSTQITEAPVEYCNVTFNDEIYRLMFTPQDVTILTASTTLRAFIRTILTKYHTIPELQRFTLRGIGANREPRPILEPWLVELIIKAAQTWRPFPPVPVDERPDGPMNTLKKSHDTQMSARVRRLISDILQYYRETRDNEGNMRRRQARGDLAEDGQAEEDEEHPGEGDDEDDDD